MTILKLFILPMVIFFGAFIGASVVNLIAAGDIGYIIPIAISLVGLLILNEVRRIAQ